MGRVFTSGVDSGVSKASAELASLSSLLDGCANAPFTGIATDVG